MKTKFFFHHQSQEFLFPDRRYVIITDHHLLLEAEALKKRLKQADIFHFPAGENSKTRATKEAIEDYLLKHHYDRETCLIALGGGVVCDLTGFVAATYHRGIDSIYIPTSLLAMVDASIGGKTGVNTLHAKNSIGSFHEPTSVYIATEYLNTLPELEFQQGCVELLKHFLLMDQVYFEKALAEPLTKNSDPEYSLEMIRRSIEIKKHVVEQDFFDQGLRKILNLGHTMAHALETLSQYQLPHGSAVAVGILMEAYIAVKLGVMSKDALNVLELVFRKYRQAFPKDLLADPAALYAAMQQDKKNHSGKVQMVFLKNIGEYAMNGEAYIFSVEEKQVREAGKWMREL